MPGNLKEVRERIRSVQNTQQITKAMKMVSAAKLRRAQQAITQMRPYANKLNAMLRNILSNVEGDLSIDLAKERPVEKACVVIVTSNRGLCGAFNSNVIKAAIKEIETKYADVRAKGDLTLLFVGKRGYDFMRKRYQDCTIISEYVNLFANLSFEKVSEISGRLMQAFEDKKYDEVTVAYGRFKNAATQFAEAERFLPVAKIESEESKLKADYIFEPDMESLLGYLIPNILHTQFFRYMLDTHASEHGARMTAMDKATENAEDLMKELRLTYNKARQESITKEILEIVGGAAALESA
ncbi:MAG: ATP synthase F1 subunit gamma [Saprospiraceae bacterium]|nr:ATP synthase F1 subunit gamma [Saprospiraceae bacterium]